MDRRVGRTRRRLKEALLELVRERGFAAITIRELTDRADVGRSTFYSHFASKEDLLFAEFDVWLLSLAKADAPAAEGGGPPRFAFSLPLLRHIDSDRRLFTTLVGSRAAGRVRRRTVDLVTEAVRRELARRPEAAGAPGVDAVAALDARARAVAGAFMGLVAWWTEAPREIGPEAADELFHAAVR